MRKEYPDWALAAAAILAVSSLVPIVIGAGIYLVNRSPIQSKYFLNIINIFVFRLVYGSEGVHDMCDYKAGVEKKFLRTETSASMKPMLGPVRVSCCATCRVTTCDVSHIQNSVRVAGHSVPGHFDLNCVSTLAMPRLKNSVQLFKTLSL